MIPNQWYAVLESREVGGDPVGVLRMGEPLVFFRDRSKRLTCLADRCAHRGAALAAGELAGERIRCPFHGLEYDREGRCTVIPANGRNAAVPGRFRVRHYPTHEEHGLIWIFWGDPELCGDGPRFFDDLDGLSWACLRDAWAAHYSRAIENQLDVAHLPFVHRTTIGRGNRTLVDGPVVQWLDTHRLRMFVHNRVDDGGRALRPEELAGLPEPEFHIELILPNLWQNHISARVRVVVAFAPVDAEHTILYLRFYQGFLRLPVAGSLLARLAMPFNRRILHQDRAVVETQKPKRSELLGGDQLFQADHPIVAYRRRRDELIRAAASSGGQSPASR